MTQPFDCITEFIFVETEIEKGDLILIPGASQPQLMERAVALYKQGIAPMILPSGGRNPRLAITEWAYLRDIGLAEGVPDHVILKEDRAKHTFENASFSLEVIRENNIRSQKVILVCKAGHARRALLTYQTVFPKETKFFVAPVIDQSGISKENWMLSEEGVRFVMAEVEKVGKYFGPHITHLSKRSERID
ncbi:YdcF family protein [Bacillus sp. JCM 19041]|uniref:YdcF family protein n=1 Tax=Bacillus sp. JCM 19041 TaxID=1460637 RepID=UPI0006D0993F